jgi:DNA-binding transcriptional ArsR family regulator
MDVALKAIADPRRREILRLVWSKELPASDIASHFHDVTRSAISQHLGVLRNANLVCERRDANRRLYRANVERDSEPTHVPRSVLVGRAEPFEECRGSGPERRRMQANG